MKSSKSIQDRRDFIKKSLVATGGLMAMSARSYASILGANDRVNVGIIGFSDRSRHTLIPALHAHSEKMNFRFTAVSDIWNRRRDEGVAFIKDQLGYKVAPCMNNEELYARKDVDAVIVGTADFQHALHGVEAANAKKDAYIEKPMAETMDDAKALTKAVEQSGIIVQIGSQRRSGANYHAANEYIKSGRFGKITMVEMTWNVNQPGRWRRPDLVNSIKESDTDWKRFLLNRPQVEWNPRAYIEYRLFWPYSSGIPGQWMSHQIDTVHWFSGYNYPRSVVANGGIYMWNDGRTNADTMTAVFDYGPANKKEEGFQVVYSSRMHNSAGGVKELYYSNAGMLNLDTNEVTPTGGLEEREAIAMNMKPNLLSKFSLTDNKTKIATAANTGVDDMVSAHMLNWMECVRNRKKPNADVWAGYWHSVANMMTFKAMETGQRVSFDPESHNIILGK